MIEGFRMKTLLEEGKVQEKKGDYGEKSKVNEGGREY